MLIYGSNSLRRGAAAAALALSALCAAAPARAQAGASAPAPAVVAQPVAPQAWMVQGASALGSPANRNFVSNAAFVVTDEGVLVVDALGSPAVAQDLLAAIRRITDKPLRYVVLTHYHADHVYGLQVLKQAGAQVIAHAAGREYLFSDSARLRLEQSRKDLAPWIDERTRLVEADRWISGPETLRLGGIEFRLVPVGPSHTAEDIAVHVPQLSLLIAGDLVFRGRVPFVGQADSAHWIRSLDTLLSLDARVIVPGHGPVSTTARADLQLTRDYLAYLRRTMGEAARNMEPFDEAYARTDWSAYEKMPLFGPANRMNAYNTYLLMERESAPK